MGSLAVEVSCFPALPEVYKVFLVVVVFFGWEQRRCTFAGKKIPHCIQSDTHPKINGQDVKNVRGKKSWEKCYITTDDSTTFFWGKFRAN